MNLTTYKEQFFHWLPENKRLERIWFIAKTDFKKRYHGSFLGLIWALLNPLVRLLIYYTVFTVVFQSREENFAMFIFLGLIHYLFFVESVTMGMRIYQTKAYLLENIQINTFDIYYAGLIASFFGFLFNMMAFGVIRLLFLPWDFSIYILYYPIVLITLLFFTLGTTLILSMIWSFFRDIKHLWELIRLALFWLSGVFYVMEPFSTWKTAVIAHLTPLCGVLINARATLLYNTPPDYWMLVYNFIYALLTLIIGMYLHKRLSVRALEKL